MSDAQESYQTFDDTQGTIILNPAGPGAPVRFPLATNFNDPLHDWVIYNGSGQDIWVAFDRDASVPNQTGYRIRPMFGMELPVISRNYISIDGGDGSDIDCHPAKYDE